MEGAVIIGTYVDMMLAEIVRARLESEGIDASITDGFAALANEGGIYGAQGVRVRVPQDQAEEARRILDAIESRD